MKNFFVTLITVFLVATGSSAQEKLRIEYLCADWGPAMTVSGKTNVPPQFSETEEEVYFLKQVAGTGVNIYLCKMKADGSEKMEIKALWSTAAYPIDTQVQACWMGVNPATKQIALSVVFAGSDLIGMWTVNLDGSDLRRIIMPTRQKDGLPTFDSPSWTLDGKWIVFGEARRGSKHSRIAKCDSLGGNITYLTDGPSDSQPRVSPDGDRILYVHNPLKQLESLGGRERWVAATLWLMNIDGTGKSEIPNPLAGSNWPTKGVSGTYPAWSPDGKRILLSGKIIDVESGKVLLERRPLLNGKPWTYGWPRWGKLGIVGFKIDGILFTDNEIREAKKIGRSTVVECSTEKERCQW